MAIKKANDIFMMVTIRITTTMPRAKMMMTTTFTMNMLWWRICKSRQLWRTYRRRI